MSDLKKLNREELNKVAKEEGIDHSKFETKKELVAALEDNRQDSEEPQENQEESVQIDDSDTKKDKQKNVVLSDAVVNALGVSRKAVLVKRGEVESIVKVDGKKVVVGNEEVSKEAS